MSLEYSVRTIFSEALEIEDLAERSRFLEAACQDNPVLRKELEELLQSHGSAGRFLSERRAAISASGERIRFEKPGDRIGEYKLLQQIGEGGCGVVYMAEQEEPVRRRVALKIIKLGMDTRSVIARFEVERQALAMMDHPNIARVFDAGATETGRPYFVMELVRGLKITEFCDQNKLKTEDRLNLFVQVCKAIQHAHQKGIIHRDLKPGNILVTMHDGVPVPKIIDFGIAKATGQERLTEKTLFTAFEQFIGTPAYMSPEQAEMSGLDIDTRTDIYSLGVLLYELLTGKTPFDSKDLLAIGVEQMRRTIREKEPALPSTRLNAMPDSELTTVARLRQADPRRMVTLLRGDLDWVVMKCLEKDRQRRYESALDPAIDVERFLHNEPVSARPPSRLYQFQKWVRRNKLEFAAAATVLLAVFVGAGISTWLYLRERAALNLAAQNARDATTQKQAAELSARSEAEQRIRTEIEKSELLFAKGDAAPALASLARVLRQQPTNRVVAERIVSALTHRRFSLPTTPPLVHGKPLKPWQGWMRKAPRRPLMTGSAIRSAQFSPNGEFVLTASRDGTAALWDSRSGMRKLSLQHPDEVYWAEFSQDAQRIVTACRDHRAYIWSATDGQLLVGPLVHEGPVTYTEFSPDGEKVVTASEDGTARIWNAKTGELLIVGPRHSDTIVTAHFSPDGEWVVSASYDGTAQVWGTKSGAIRSRFGDVNALFFANFSPDGEKVVTGGFSSVLNVWRASSGTPVIQSLAHWATVTTALFSLDGKLVLSADQYNRVKFWDAETGRELPREVEHGGPIHSLAMSPDGKTVATASSDATAQLWDVESGRPVSEPLKHDSAVILVSFSPGGERVLTVSDASQVLIWTVPARASPALELPQLDPRLGVGRFSPDGSKVVIGGKNYFAKLWDVRTGELDSRFFADSRHVSAADFSPNRKLLATASVGGLLKMWDLKTREGRAIVEHPNGIVLVRFSPDSKLLLSSSYGGVVNVFDTESGELRFALNQGFVPMADFSPDGTQFVTASSHRAQVWDTHSGSHLGEPLTHEQDVNFVQYSRDGRWIVTASQDKTVRVWNAETGEASPRMLHDEAVRLAVFSPDGSLVLTISGNSARLWDSRTGRPRPDLLLHNARVNSAFFSPDGRYIVTASDDSTARIWDTATSLPVSEALHHPSAVPYGEFSPDGRWVLTIDHSGSARIWEAPENADRLASYLPDLAEAFGGQKLTPDGQFQRVPPTALWTLAQSLLKREQTSDDRWIQWLFSASSNRTVSPSSSVLLKDNLRRIRSVEYTTRGDEFASNNQWTNAIADYTTALTLFPDQVDVLIWRAYACEQIGRFQECEADLRRAIQLQSHDFLAYNNLAFLLAHHLQRPEQALPIAEKALALSDGNHHPLNVLGLVYYRLGKFEKAREVLEKSEKMFQQHDALIARERFILSMVHHQLGNSSQAEEYYQKALQWLAENPRWQGVDTREPAEPFRADAAALLGKETARD